MDTRQSLKMAVYDSFNLHITSDKFIIEPNEGPGAVKKELMVIDRVTQEIMLQAHRGQIPAAAITKKIYGIVGIIRLVAGPYLIVITRRVRVGEMYGQFVWQMAETESHSYKRTMLHLTEQQSNNNRTYLSMLDLVLNTDAFYFSNCLDLTHTMQRLRNTSPDFLSLTLHERADQRFVWNGHMLREFAQQPELGKYCLPIIHGYVNVCSSSINNKKFEYVLISRRCIFRAGTRFFMRGVDSEGQVANFVETEQIVQHDGIYCSFVQTRGSIPLYWTQKPDLKRMPLPVLNGGVNHMDGFQRHFDDQIYNYGKQVLINLVNHKGYEDQMEKAFKETVINSHYDQIRYVPFDFHKECSKMRWDRLSLLTDDLTEDRLQFGYCMVGRDGQVNLSQTGVFRTNCMDCLDRTNVVQSLLAHDTLVHQLQRMSVLEMSSGIPDQCEFDLLFKNVWADHADYLSTQYAGTGALKTDFTRTGKRTNLGLLNDGWNSVIRYFKNNFQDGFRQDAIDLFLGNYQVEETEGITTQSPLSTERDWKYYAIPVIFLVAMAMFVISILLPDEHFTEQVLYVVFWGAASVIAMAMMFRYGSEYVDQPRLSLSKAKME